MINAQALVKQFDDVRALDGLNCTIDKGSIYGLVGPNGSGKSTFLRLIAGVHKPDSGNVFVDGEPPFENNSVKQKVYFVPDDPFYFGNYTMDKLARFYKDMYDEFDYAYYERIANMFPLNRKQRISTFSKGMKRQTAIIMAVAAKPSVLLLDEAFDGIDPVIRELLKRLLADLVCERQLTVMIASHNLRELEALCDHIGLIHKGGILFEREIDELKLGITNIQAAFETVPAKEELAALNVVKYAKQGKLLNLTVKDSFDEAKSVLDKFSPLFVQGMPLTLEEVFISEMEVVGYDFSKIIL